jgi:putative endonuclease
MFKFTPIDRHSGEGRNLFFRQKGFTQEYSVKNLVWYEFHEDMASAIKRESQIKNWKRDWKIKRIVAFNPLWYDLHEEIDYDLPRFNVKRTED